MPRLLYTKRLVDLEEDEREAVLICNMGSNGSMRAKVKDLLATEDTDARVTMCWDENILQGCCLTFRHHNGTRYVYTYVYEKYRRRGIGTALIAHARRGRRKPMRCVPWDERSRAFYSPLLAAGKVTAR
jgi:GNAT superfamily N-acetyltransferase